MDIVIDRHKKQLEAAKLRHTLACARRDRAEKAVVSHTGAVRHNVAQEVASRNVEIEALKRDVADKERQLKHADADSPRRKEALKKAVELYEKAAFTDEGVIEMRKQLVELEALAAEIRAEAQKHGHAATHTAEELKREEANATAIQEHERAEARRALEFEVRSATAALRNAEANHNEPEESLVRKREVLHRAEEALKLLDKGA